MSLDQLDVALLVGRALERTGAAWMIGGSIATSLYGEPRSTHDVDLVSDLLPVQVDAFLDAVGEAFYVDRDAVIQAVRSRRSFNLVHFDTAEKVDVFCVGTPFARAGLDARIVEDIGGRATPVAAPGHMVVEKLRWYRLGGEVSDRQWRDVQGVLQVGGRSLDLGEMAAWADEVGVRDLLDRALADAGLRPLR